MGRGRDGDPLLGQNYVFPFFRACGAFPPLSGCATDAISRGPQLS